MKLYALFTLHETGWGTRTGIGDRKSAYDLYLECSVSLTSATAATAAQEKQDGSGGGLANNNTGAGFLSGERESYDVEMNGRKN